MSPTFLKVLIRSITPGLAEHQCSWLVSLKWWEYFDAKQAAILQLEQPYLCFPVFEDFREIVEKAVMRPVSREELDLACNNQEAYDKLKAEIIARNN